MTFAAPGWEMSGFEGRRSAYTKRTFVSFGGQAESS
jgi:hypothetical protein